ADRRDVHRTAVEQHVTMTHQLARGHAARREAGAEDEVVETALEQFEQLLAGRRLGTLGLAEQAANLAFGQAVVEAQLLLLGQTQREVGTATVLLAMLARRIVATFGRR